MSRYTNSSLVLVPHFAKNRADDWELVGRVHDLAGTDYIHVCYLSTAQAYIAVDYGDVRFLYGDPRSKDRD